MTETPSKRRRRGRLAYFPGEDPNQHLPYKGWGAELFNKDFLDGWREAEQANAERESAEAARDPKDTLLERLRDLAEVEDLERFVDELEIRKTNDVADY